MQWILLILGVILAVVAVFALQNPEVVTVRFLNLSAEASVLVVVLIAFAAGVVSGVLALVPTSIRRASRVRRLRSEVKGLEKAAAASEAERVKSEAERVKEEQRHIREMQAAARAALPEHGSPASDSAGGVDSPTAADSDPAPSEGASPGAAGGSSSESIADDVPAEEKRGIRRFWDY